MLTSSQVKSLVFAGLTEAQQEAAAGRFCDPPVLVNDEVAVCVNYFGKDLPDLVRKFTLSSANAILFVQGESFKLLSSPKLALDDGGLEILIGVDGTRLFHPSPISIPAKDATMRALILLLVSSDQSDPSALHFLGASRYVSDPITITGADDDDGELVAPDGELADSIAFPFPVSPEAPDFQEYKVALMPLAVPLPPGHRLDPVSFADDVGLTVLMERLQDISQQHAEWANAMLLHRKLYAGQSLHLASPAIHPAFFEGLPADETYPSTTFVMATPVSPSSAEGKDLLRRAIAARNDNIDRWFVDHPTIYQEHASRYATNAMATSAPSHVSSPSSAPAPLVYESLKDRSAKHNIARSRAITRLLLSREGTNAEGSKVLVPGQVSSMFEDAINDTAPRAVRYFVEHLTALKQAKCDSMDSVNVLTARFPPVLLTSSFVATALNAYWSTLSLQQEQGMVGHTLNFFSFAPARTSAAENKRLLDETTTALNEDLVGVAASQRTKASLQLYGGGNIASHQDLLQTIANLILVLEALDAPDHGPPPVFVTALRQLFQCLVHPDVSHWVHTFARRPEGKHLPYALAFEINNGCFVQFARFASNSTWTRAVLEGSEIPHEALSEFGAVFLLTINNWRKISMTLSLSHYSSPPSTWVSPEVLKEAAKKAAKTTEISSPSAKPAAKAGGASSSSPTAPRISPKDPLFGMVIVPDNIRHGPQLSMGKRLCLPFSTHGKLCAHGYNCTNAHVTLTKASIPDLQAIERWVLTTPNVDWALGRPKRLTEADPATTPVSPPPPPPPAQVSPPAAANHAQG